MLKTRLMLFFCRVGHINAKSVVNLNSSAMPLITFGGTASSDRKK